jgi:hypothetical protein
MKQKTRDNLIYLAVGIGIVALILADLFYADSHGREVWWPSRFAFRAVFSTALLLYFVARETRKSKATLDKVLTCVLLAGVVHLAIVFEFRHAVDQLSGITFSALAVVEMSIVFLLLMAAVRHVRPWR